MLTSIPTYSGLPRTSLDFVSESRLIGLVMNVVVRRLHMYALDDKVPKRMWTNCPR